MKSESKNTAMKNNCAHKVYIASVVATIVIWVSSMVIGGVYMSNDPRGKHHDKDHNGHNDENRHHKRSDDTDFAPAAWAFSIWFFIYFWQIIFFFYGILSIFPKFNLYKIPVVTLLFYNIASLASPAWILCDYFDLEWPGVLTIAAMPFSIYICMLISIRAVYKRKMMYFAYTYAVHNALAVYAGWLTIAVLLTTAMGMIREGMDKQITGTIMLSVLAVELIVFCTLENTILEKFLRHIWSHYISFTVAIIGSIAKNWDPLNRNSILTVAIGGFLVSSMCVKMMRLLSAKCARPDQPSDEVVTEKVPVVAFDDKVPLA